MTRSEAEARVQLWLVLTEEMNNVPSYETASRLSTFIYNLTDGKEVFSTGFIYDTWKMYRGDQK